MQALGSSRGACRPPSLSRHARRPATSCTDLLARRISCRAAVTGSPVLSESESVALSAYNMFAVQQAPSSNSSKQKCLDLLREAARDRKIEPELVEGALVALEMEQLAAGIVQGDPKTVEGRWHLLFSSATKIRAFQYIPIREEFVVDLPSRNVALESSIGPFAFFIKGTSTAWDEEQAALEFQFNKVVVKLLGNEIWTTSPTTKAKTYTFFYLSDTIAGCRSSGGGMSLLVRL
ncbi:MAG: hypothetical protein WDW38_004566 [Sanguina aurantia]